MAHQAQLRPKPRITPVAKRAQQMRRVLPIEALVDRPQNHFTSSYESCHQRFDPTESPNRGGKILSPVIITVCSESYIRREF